MITEAQFQNELQLIIQNGIREDIGEGDHSSLACIPSTAQGKAKLLVKDKGIIAGVEFAKMIFKYVDQSPLIDMNSAKAIESSWQIGIDTKQINEIIDCFEPLIYRQDVTAVADLAKNYLEGTDTGITAILRPTYPDSTSQENLVNKVSALVNLGVSDIDFYLLDTMRTSDLESIKHSINK